jgi:hypothetical protein
VVFVAELDVFRVTPNMPRRRYAILAKIIQILMNCALCHNAVNIGFMID